MKLDGYLIINRIIIKNYHNVCLYLNFFKKTNLICKLSFENKFKSKY